MCFYMKLAELVRVANLPLAREFIAQTASLSSNDPALWHEAAGL